MEVLETEICALCSEEFNDNDEDSCYCSICEKSFCDENCWEYHKDFCLDWR